MNRLRLALPFVLMMVSGAGLMYAGCGATGAQIGGSILAGGFDVVQCAPDEYQSFKAAAHDGGPAWIGAILDTLHCAGKVAADVMAQLHVAQLDELERATVSEDAFAAFMDGRRAMLAATDDESTQLIAGERWSRRGLKRLVRCVKMAKALGYAKEVK